MLAGAVQVIPRLFKVEAVTVGAVDRPGASFSSSTSMVTSMAALPPWPSSTRTPTWWRLFVS